MVLLLSAASHAAESEFASRTWTDRKGNQLTSTFVDAKNGEVLLKNDAGEVQKFKLADFSEPDQKYLRDLAAYRRKLAAGEKAQLPADPALVSLDIQPRQTLTEPAPDMQPSRKPLLEFPIRVWTDVTGKKVQGKLVTAYNDKIVIDVKGNAFDLPVTRLSPDDQAYVAVQLKGLQRDDLVTILAKAATPEQGAADAASTPTPTPEPTTVATNNPAATAPSNTDDIHARLAQLRAQAQGDLPAEPPVAAKTPPAEPPSNDDIKARLAQIRQEKSEPEPENLPATPSETPPVYTPPSPVTENIGEPTTNYVNSSNQSSGNTNSAYASGRQVGRIIGWVIKIVGGIAILIFGASKVMR